MATQMEPGKRRKYFIINGLLLFPLGIYNLYLGLSHPSTYFGLIFGAVVFGIGGYLLYSGWKTRLLTV